MLCSTCSGSDQAETLFHQLKEDAFNLKKQKQQAKTPKSYVNIRISLSLSFPTSSLHAGLENLKLANKTQKAKVKEKTVR